MKRLAKPYRTPDTTSGQRPSLRRVTRGLAAWLTLSLSRLQSVARTRAVIPADESEQQDDTRREQNPEERRQRLGA
jgi:hypothetical protein